MKRKKLFNLLLVLCCSACFLAFTAFFSYGGFFARANTETDVTDKVDMAFHSEYNGIVEIDLTFDGITNVFPVGTTSGTWVNDHADLGSVDLMRFIKIGNKTARTIVNENNAKPVSQQYKGIVNGWGGQWAPVAVLVDGNGIIRIKVLTQFCAYENLVVTLVSDGFRWETSDGNTLTLTKDVVYYNKDGEFTELKGELDVASRVDMIKASESGGIVEIDLTFDGITNVWPDGTTSGTWVNDHADLGSVDLMQFIRIGDKTARTIVNENNEKPVSQQYKGIVNGWGGQWAPVAVLVDGNGIVRIKVMTDYCTYENLEITLVSEGFSWQVTDSVFGNVTLTLSENRTFVNYKGKFVEKLNRVVLDDKVQVTVNGFDLNGASDLVMKFDGITEVRAVDIEKDPTGKIAKGQWVNDNTKGYGNDYSRGVDLMQYILINGRTAREIVLDNYKGITNYKGPINSNMGGIYAPIGICVEPNGIFRIKVLNEYLNYTDLRITLKAGLEWRVYNADAAEYDTLLLTETDTTFYYKNGSIVKWDNENDRVVLDEKISVETLSIGNDDIYRILFDETFNDTAQWTVDKPTSSQLYELQEKITFNGKTVLEINTETDDTGWEYTNLPLNIDAFKVPVRVLFDKYDGKTLFTVYVHKNYTAENPTTDISVKALDWTFNSVKHGVTEEIFFKESGDEFKRVCFVTFKNGDETVIKSSVFKGEKLSNEQIPDNPVKEGTDEIEYVFDGWFYKNSENVEMLFEPKTYPVIANYDLYSKFRQIGKRYNVTYLDRDGNVYKTEEVSFGDDIVHPATPAIEYYTGIWEYTGDGEEPQKMPKQDIEFKAAYSPTVYKVTFYSDEKGLYPLKELTYTIENPVIEEPEVAPKDGFSGVWAQYELKGGDVDVLPVYTEINGGGCKSSAGVGGIWAFTVVLGGAVLLVKNKKRKKA